MSNEPKFCTVLHEPTGADVIKIEDTDNLYMHPLEIVHQNDETGERWILCWFRVCEGPKGSNHETETP